MKRVLHFPSREGEYHCDAVVVACFDHRFSRVLRRMLRGIGVHHPDAVIVAGGAKSLASPEHESDRDFLLAQVEKSIRLHSSERVILMAHSDCGAYGGLRKRFQGDKHAEVEHHKIELQHAHAELTKRFPQLSVEGYFLDFHGVWQLESFLTNGS